MLSERRTIDLPRPPREGAGIDYQTESEQAPLLRMMLEAYGGLARFRGYRGVTVSGWIGGWALSRPWLPLRGRVTVDFANERVASLPAPIASALWDHFQTPFLYARRGVVCEELEPAALFGRARRRLRVVFPPRLLARPRRTVCWVDPDIGLIDRLDHHFDDEGGRRANLRHYLADHQPWGGIVVAGRRRTFHRSEPLVRVRRHLDWCFAAMDGLVEGAEFIPLHR
jgi:hypothetical protein